MRFKRFFPQGVPTRAFDAENVASGMIGVVEVLLFNPAFVVIATEPSPLSLFPDAHEEVDFLSCPGFFRSGGF